MKGKLEVSNSTTHDRRDATIKSITSSSNKTEIKINALLTEYSALREESLMNFNQQQRSIIWIGTTIYILFAFIIKYPEMKILFLFFPFLIYTWVGFTIKSDCKILILASYLECISEKIDYLLNSSLMKWENLAKIIIRRPTLFKKFSSLFIHFMMLIPFLIIFVYSFVLGHNYLENLNDLESKLLWIKLYDYCIPLISILYVFCIIWYFNINLKKTKEFCKNELIKFKKIEKI